MNEGSVTVAANSTADSENWEDQLKDIEEAEKWEKSAHKIPVKLQAKFSELTLRYSASRRILIYKLMDIFLWDEEHCSHLYELFRKTVDERIDWLLSLIYRYYDEAKRLIRQAFMFLTNLNERSLLELVNDINEDIFDNIISLLRHQPDSEIIKMAQLINESNFNVRREGKIQLELL